MFRSIFTKVILAKAILFLIGSSASYADVTKSTIKTTVAPDRSALNQRPTNLPCVSIPSRSLTKAFGARAPVFNGVANIARECASPEDMKAIASGYSALAFDLYQTRPSYPDYNFLYSSGDTMQVLAMLAEGAKGETLKAAWQDMRTGLTGNRLHKAFSAALLDSENRNQAANLKQNFAIWGQSRSRKRQGASYHFAAPFLNRLIRSYGAQIAKVDFTDDQALGRAIPDAINQWVMKNTDGAIPGLVYELPERTRLTAVTTLSVDGAWQTLPASGDQRFALLDGSHVLTPMLTFSGEFLYLAGEGINAFELPLANSDLALTVLMPNEGRFAEFRSGLTAEKLDQLLSNMKPQTISVQVPNFRLHSSLWPPSDIMTHLVDSGVFIDGQADFSRVNGRGFLHLDNIDQHGSLNLDELGVQAHSASEIVLRASLFEPAGNLYGVVITSSVSFIPCQDIPFWNPDLAQARPFIYLLRNRFTDTILFMGQFTEADGAKVAPDSVTINCRTTSVESTIDWREPEYGWLTEEKSSE